jgi:hypothetical protein
MISYTTHKMVSGKNFAINNFTALYLKIKKSMIKNKYTLGIFPRYTRNVR